jgi:hypothetical protein
MACLTDLRGEFMGYFDAIPLVDSFARTFIRGDVTEAQITHEDVLSAEDMSACRYLFLSGIAVWNPDTFSGRRSASILVWAFLRYLEHFYADAGPLIIAIASTSPGDKLLRRFKFDLESDPTSRADKYRLYSIQLTEKGVARRRACLPDWSKLCRLDWEHKTAVDPATARRRRRPSLPETRVWNLIARSDDARTRRT